MLVYRFFADRSTEPLRRGDLLNSITRLASERVRARKLPIPIDFR